jgi:spore photoproduct lyase
MVDLQGSIRSRFIAFGVNKQQEIGRLVAEIAKREGCTVQDVLAQVPAGCKAYPAVKSYFLKRRFPEALRRGGKISEVFTSFEIDPSQAVTLGRVEKVPAFKRIFIESAAEASDLSRRALARYPKAQVHLIDSYKEYCGQAGFDTLAFNRRAEDLFIVREKFDHFKPCPCSPGVVSCGYHNANLGFGCPFECTYCFLQNYTNAPGIVLPADLDDFFDAFKGYRSDIRLGSGETTDSLVYDDLTGFSARIVEFFRPYPQSTFEFKTKSDNIQGLLSVKAASNIVVGWSLNPQEIINSEEHFTASLDKRLEAARRCVAHGYRVAFHFDPVIYFKGWEALYEDVVARLFKAVPAESMAWISVGALRMTRQQKKIIENRFPRNTILDAELLTAEDGKLRYSRDVRVDIYTKMLSWIRSRASGATKIYLCMEMEGLWSNIIQEKLPRKRSR